MNMQIKLIGSTLLCSTLFFMGCSNSNTQNNTSNNDSSNTENTSQSKLPDNAPTYNVATSSDFSPFSYRDENGQLLGYDVDLINAIGEQAGFRVNISPGVWDKWTETLDNGTVDIWMGGIAAKKDRNELVKFSNPYLSYNTAVLTRNDEAGQEINRDNLQNYRIAAQEGTVDLEYAKSLHSKDPENAIGVKTNFLGVRSVLDNTADAVISNDKVLRYYYTDLVDGGNLRIFSLDEEQDPEKQLGFAVKKGRTELADKINQGLEAIKQNGTYNKINEKWFGSEQ